ncbi:protein YgfX [Burkholderia guangdongensis]|uniref:protein YgfX n=1 Tax=Burkholderia guangdongensis TaxID=1792500 RepID=UPI0015CEECA0|nr:protein YgfX [Burkholderia guangdongensis]
MTSPLDVAAARTQRFTLRASAALCLALAVFVVAAACAVHLFVAPRAGVVPGAGGAIAAALLLAAAASRACARRMPAELRVDASGQIAAFGRAGRMLAHGGVTGCVHWSSLLLVLSVGARGRRPVRLLIPADALDAAAFRALSVLARGA